MATFKEIVQILNDAVENSEVGPPHGAFWRDKTRDQFVATAVLGCPILYKDGAGKFVGKNSLMVQILRGPVKDCNAKSRPQMPAGGFAPLPDDKVSTIEKWIDDQCPE